MPELSAPVKRFKNLRLFKTGPQEDVKDDDGPKPSFFKLNSEQRMKIYEYAFMRTPVEQFQALHYGPRANSASGLVLTCKLIRQEVKELYHKDSTISLWSHFFRTNPKILLPTSPIVTSWHKSREGRILKKHPEEVRQLGMLLMLTRDPATLCQDYLEADILRSPRLQITDLYIRVCICTSLSWLYNSPSSIMAFCIALELFAAHFPTLQRIHIMYCGQTWPTWIESPTHDVPFPDIVLASHTVRMFSGGNWSIHRVTGKEPSRSAAMGRDPAQIQPRPDQEVIAADADECSLRTVMTWNHSQVEVHPGKSMIAVPWKERSVEVNYYDSREIIDGSCVRDKPAQSQGKDNSCKGESLISTDLPRRERKLGPWHEIDTRKIRSLQRCKESQRLCEELAPRSGALDPSS